AADGLPPRGTTRCAAPWPRAVYWGRDGAATVTPRRRLRPAETSPRTRKVKAPSPAPISCALISRSVVYLITAGRLTSACGCPLCARRPASLYQPRAGGATTDAAAAPRIAPSRTKITTVLATPPPFARRRDVRGNPMPRRSELHPPRPGTGTP